jgi:hypothetical protein
MLDAIAAVLNDADSGVSSRNFRVRKKAYHRGNTWESGGWIAPMFVQRQREDNTSSFVDYRCAVWIVDPKDADLVSGLGDHLGDVERITEIFDHKSHIYAPAGLRTALSGLSAPYVSAFEKTSIEPAELFQQQAFESGYDASGVVIVVSVRQPVFSSANLG